MISFSLLQLSIILQVKQGQHQLNHNIKLRDTTTKRHSWFHALPCNSDLCNFIFPSANMFRKIHHQKANPKKKKIIRFLLVQLYILTSYDGVRLAVG